ncbi:hypothetical protein DACRYDRAFT_107162 [Dacryopinax primogenitus]|uniref:Uncharacterized protein n=1 Tax=Dacryopinax primogenitus (strain DJM 731) TaxID=1858805 RepID=M5GDB5_DACPD|nr:uncharacterized protein DACRYDRAFT_107162 [Dacryopinax primogenitus]EJU02228.1 hypothetical protein DACRYDRAFT_107162 [Dacryopinax primogenitus]
MAWRDADSPALLKYSGMFLQCLHHLICNFHIMHTILSESLRMLHSDIKKSGKLDDNDFLVMVAPWNTCKAANAIYHIKRGKLIPMVDEELEKTQVAYHCRHDNSSKKGKCSHQVDKGKQQAKCMCLDFDFRFA